MTADDKIKEVMKLVDKYCEEKYAYWMCRLSKDSMYKETVLFQEKLRQLIKDDE